MQQQSTVDELTKRLKTFATFFLPIHRAEYNIRIDGVVTYPAAINTKEKFPQPNIVTKLYPVTPSYRLSSKIKDISTAYDDTVKHILNNRR